MPFSPSCRCVFLSMHDQTIFAERALKSGARAYMMKHEAPKALVEAIKHPDRYERAKSLQFVVN